MRKELIDDVAYVQEVYGDYAEAIGVGARIGGTLDSLSVVLEHFGTVRGAQASTSGDQTPLMRLCDEPKRSSLEGNEGPPAGGPSFAWGGVRGGGRRTSARTFLQNWLMAGGEMSRPNARFASTWRS